MCQTNTLDGCWVQTIHGHKYYNRDDEPDRYYTMFLNDKFEDMAVEFQHVLYLKWKNATTEEREKLLRELEERLKKPFERDVIITDYNRYMNNFRYSVFFDYSKYMDDADIQKLFQIHDWRDMEEFIIHIRFIYNAPKFEWQFFD